MVKSKGKENVSRPEGEAGSESESVDVGDEDSDGTGLRFASTIESWLRRSEREEEVGSRQRKGRRKLGRRKVGKTETLLVEELIFES